MSIRIAGKSVGSIGFGLKDLTAPSGPSFEKSIELMKYALESGATFWNGADFYGPPERNSLHLLKAYFTQYPEDAEKVVVSLKSCLVNYSPKCDPESIDGFVTNAVDILGGTKKIDIFLPARIDPDVDIRTTVAALASHVQAGRIDSIGVGECSAETLRKASSVHPIEMNEIELSLLSSDPLVDGVADACKEHGVVLVAYSPLSRGLLTDKLRDHSNISPDDIRMRFPRFQPENFEANKRLVDVVARVAKRRGYTLPQVAIAWVVAQGRKPGVPAVLPIPGARAIERIEENMTLAKLDVDDLAELDRAVNEIEVQGARYPTGFPGRR